MNTYTLSHCELAKVKAARALQVANYRADFLRDKGKAPPNTDPQSMPHLAHVEFVNGVTLRGALPLALLERWEKTLGGESEITLGKEGDVLASIGLRVKRAQGVSSIIARTPVFIPANKRQEAPFTWLGAPIRLIAPQDGGAFVCDFDETKIAALGAAKKELAKAKRNAAKLGLIA